LLLIHGEDDATVPISAGRRLASMAGPSSRHWIVPGADHSGAHRLVKGDYERRTTDFLRMAMAAARDHDAAGAGEHQSGSIIGEPDPPAGPTVRATPTED
jgi:fermentation-respiration switch protein FrsA (DUF1100 family)